MFDVNKAARDYLIQSGARPISIVETEGICKFVLKADPAALVTFWTHQEGSALLKAARQIAGKSCPDVATATEPLQRAAVQLILALMGGLVGAVLGAAAAVAIAWKAGWPILISPWAIILACGFAGFIGISFGLYPAHRAARLDPIVALRFE